MLVRNRFPVAAILGALIGTALFGPATAETKPRGAFQFWTLAMSYQTEFCTTHARNPECTGGIAKVKGLTLHGFWPSLNSGAIYEGPLSYARVPISETTIWQLATVMPSADCHIGASYSASDFCLVDHEWEVHGTLSGQAPDFYFQTAKLLADRFRALPGINGLIERHSGRTASAGELKAALALDLPGEPTKLVCEFKNDREQWLVEIEVALDITRYDAFPTPASFHRPFHDYARSTPNGATHYCPTRVPIHIQ